MTLMLKSGGCGSGGCGDGEGSVQVQLDPAVRIGTAQVFAVYGKPEDGAAAERASMISLLQSTSNYV